MTNHVPTRQLIPAATRSAQAFLAPIQREFDRLSEQMGAGWSNLASYYGTPSMDVHETEDSLEITAELPGLSQDDLTLSVDGGVLTIAGEKKTKKDQAAGGYRIAERTYGAFSRMITLPAHVEVAKMTAELKDGVLTIRAPKDGKVKAHKIAIQAK